MDSTSVELWRASEEAYHLVFCLAAQNIGYLVAHRSAPMVLLYLLNLGTEEHFLEGTVLCV